MAQKCLFVIILLQASFGSASLFLLLVAQTSLRLQVSQQPANGVQRLLTQGQELTNLIDLDNQLKCSNNRRREIKL